MRVASWNIRKAVGRDMRRDPLRVLQGLAKLEADVVVLQEADKRLGSRPAALPRALIAPETGLRPVPVAMNGVSLGFHGNALLVGPRMQVMDAGRLPLPGLEPRGAVWASLRCEAMPDAVLHVIGCHLGFLRYWRRRQLRTIREHLPEDWHAHAIVAGDFNEWSGIFGLEDLSPLRAHAPGPSFPSLRPSACLDRIAHGPALRVAASGVGRSDEHRTGSDHLPVWAELAHSRDAL